MPSLTKNVSAALTTATFDVLEKLMVFSAFAGIPFTSPKEPAGAGGGGVDGVIMFEPPEGAAGGALGGFPLEGLELDEFVGDDPVNGIVGLGPIEVPPFGGFGVVEPGVKMTGLVVGLFWGVTGLVDTVGLTGSVMIAAAAIESLLAFAAMAVESPSTKLLVAFFNLSLQLCACTVVPIKHNAIAAISIFFMF
ncbi:MAG: hypothetical protein JKX68_09275 [Flavobacteriales bacterium]|nr:hypothetical protein [Flavobacteriales bacterium]